jgi:hypothetical protein
MWYCKTKEPVRRGGERELEEASESKIKERLLNSTFKIILRIFFFIK